MTSPFGTTLPMRVKADMPVAGVFSNAGAVDAPAITDATAITSPFETTLPIRVKADMIPVAGVLSNAGAVDAPERASGVADVEKAQSGILYAIAQTRARAKESAKGKVGGRGPVPAGKGLVVPDKKTKQKANKKVSHDTRPQGFAPITKGSRSQHKA